MRPLAPPIRFATDPTYPAGAEAWSGQPTRVRPADPILARGFLPDRRLPAPWANEIFGDVADRVARIDLLEALNWSPRVTGMSSPPANVSRCAAWDPIQGVVWAVRADGVSRSADGFIWTDDTSISSPTGLRGIAVYGNTTCTVEEGKRYFSVSGGAWTAASLATALDDMDIRGVVANTEANVDAGGDPFYAFGQDVGGTPKIVGIPADASRTLSGTLPTSTIYWVVPVDGFILAVDLAGRLWRAAHGADTWTRGPSEPAISGNVAAVFFDERRELVVLLTASGQCWTSEDGIVWTQRTSIGANVSLDIAWVDGIAWEGIWLVTGKDLDRAFGDRRLFVSTDAGVTWSQYPAPPLGEHVQCWVRGLDGDGLIAFGGGYACRSLRLP